MWLTSPRPKPKTVNSEPEALFRLKMKKKLVFRLITKHADEVEDGSITRTDTNAISEIKEFGNVIETSKLNIFDTYVTSNGRNWTLSIENRDKLTQINKVTIIGQYPWNIKSQFLYPNIKLPDGSLNYLCEFTVQGFLQSKKWFCRKNSVSIPEISYAMQFFFNAK